jgi:hypothetical protein
MSGAETMGSEQLEEQIELTREPTPSMEAAVLKELAWIKDETQRAAHLEEYKRRWRLMFDAATGGGQL